MNIKIENFTKTLKRKCILDNINLELDGAKIYGIEGINGSGKTMLMRAILGFIKGDTGQVIVNGEALTERGRFPQNVGFLLENPAFLDNYSAKDNLKFIADINKKVGDKEIEDYLNKVDLDPTSKKIYKKFSLGMKQRLGIAAAFFESPELLVLDEPMNALDSDGVEKVKKMIFDHKAKGGLCFLSCHDKEILEELADEIIKIHEGRIEGIRVVQK